MKELLESLGWVDQNDRGMAENNGYLFSKGVWSLQYWRVHPRIYVTNGKSGTDIKYFDTRIVEEGISLDDVKTIMDRLGIE